MGNMGGTPIGKAELAMITEVAPSTISRIEPEKTRRMETKRKILRAFGYEIPEKRTLFPDH
jgi:DNA-binding XRE family transcriptional regulator